MATYLSGCFSGYCWPREKGNVVVIGAPLEATVSFRPGTRFAPRSIREASAFIEYWSLRANLDVDEAVRFYDAGDALVEQPLRKALEAIAASIVENLDGRPLVVLGGEHTITYGVVQGLLESGRKPCILQLDAHMDMRDEYAGHKLSHATFMRRIVEHFRVPVLQVGVRGFAREELEYVQAHRIPVIDAREFSERGVSDALSLLLRLLEQGGCNHLHVTLDMDVFDPSAAPGVSNPEPEGPPTSYVIDVVFEAARLAASRGMSISMDVVEVAPPYDCGNVTSVLAAKTIVEFIAGWLRGAK